jgi:hypothetical protein
MLLLKSDKAREELASRQRVLSVRERSALFLADGIRSRDELIHLMRGDIGLLQKLMTNGYLVASETLGVKSAHMTDFAKSKVKPAKSFLRQSEPAPTAAPVLAQPKLAGPNAITRNDAAPTQSADNFEGKRSLATARMFLFDIVERMFVRKMPELANHLRDQLREARDRTSMLVVAREIILKVEEIAGPDRADGLSERLAMMLPPEQ